MHVGDEWLNGMREDLVVEGNKIPSVAFLIDVNLAEDIDCIA